MIVVRDDQELIRELGVAVERRRPAIEAQGAAHEDLDIRLTTCIEDFLRSILGPQEKSASGWFQSMDYYGDGIRHLEFGPGRLPLDAMPQLKAMLTGEHRDFGILCWAESELAPDRTEGVALFSDCAIVTKGLKGLVRV
jgi:hypothetical protein